MPRVTMGTDARPWILGIASSHNGAVCLLHGDNIVVAIQEERLLRRKRAIHPGGRSSLAIRYCLDFAGLAPRDLDLIVLACRGPNGGPMQDLSLNPALRPVHNRVRTMMIGHHLAHAVGAFATSGFTAAAVLIVDGTGSPLRDLSTAEQQAVGVGQVRRCVRPGRSEPDETVSLYAARHACMEPIEKQIGTEDLRPKAGMRRFWSLGSMYASAGRQIFGSGLEGAGKMMGLAPYGSPVIPASDYYAIEDGRFDFLDALPDRYPHDDRWPLRREEYQDLAASTQRALEEAVCMLAARLRRLSGARRLCYAGGVALNSVANERLIRTAGFDEVFIMPAAEDSGTAIGAAYHGLWQLTGRNTVRRLAHDAVGRSYAPAEVLPAIERCPAVRIEATGDLLDPVVDLLCDGKILGWFRGRSELGPRALGQRSIICDPRRADMKDVLNRTIKFREAFRPFAPVIPLQHLETYFDTSHAVESPFMLRVLSFWPDVRARVPAVVHVDGTGRVQTVTPEANGPFYDLVQRFYQKTGCPVLLNTSFNVAGEPIVETPDDALGCLLSTGLDACVLENWLVMKRPTYRSFLDLVLKVTADRVAVDHGVAPGWGRHDISADEPLRFFQSFHVDGARSGNDRVAEGARPVLRIEVRTRWGRVMHVVGAGVFEVLTRIDGQRSGWHILDLLRRDCRRDIDEHTLTTILAGLRRASIVGW
jgi:carbamoyltransferase